MLNFSPITQYLLYHQATQKKQTKNHYTEVIVSSSIYSLVDLIKVKSTELQPNLSLLEVNADT